MGLTADLGTSDGGKNEAAGGEAQTVGDPEAQNQGGKGDPEGIMKPEKEKSDQKPLGRQGKTDHAD